MKRIVSAGTLWMFVLLFEGCTPATFHQIQTPKPLKSEITLVLPKDPEDKRVWIKNNTSLRGVSLEEVDRQMAETFYAAAIYGKRQGYRYFAVTAKSMNNLQGFPINSFDNVVAFCNWEKTNEAYRPRPLCRRHGILSGNVRLEVIYFKKPLPGLFLYNVDEVIRQTAPYLR